MVMAEEKIKEPIVYGAGLYTVELNDGLTEQEQEEAYKILCWLKGSGPFFGIAGLMLITGMPRQGKGLFSNTFSWKIKRYFKGIRILRDDHPGPIYGEYSLFDESVLAGDLEAMSEIAKIKKPDKKLIDKWVTEKGQVMIHKAVLQLDEGWRYQNNRRPMAEMNIALGGLNKLWGHTETLTMLQAQWYHDLDRFTCLPWVTHEVRCQMSTEKENTIEAHLYRVKYNVMTSRLIVLDKAIKLYIDGAKERPELGVSHVDADGTPHYYRYFDLYNSKSAPMMKYKGGQL